jgi:acetyltransferase
VKDLFWAESVAVIGVSESEDNLAKNIVGNLLKFGYRGKIFAVGPGGGEIFGSQIYRSVTDLPGKPYLAVILTPASSVPEIFAQCGEKGIRWAVIQSGGFREFRAEGEILEHEIVKTSQKYGIRFVGPNCVGIINTAIGLYTPFVDLPKPFTSGRVGVFAQSGGVMFSLVERLCTSGVGISKAVSMGNKLCTDEAEYMAFAKDEPDIDVIYFYLEDLKRARIFADLARQCSKPVVLHKSNTSSLSRTIARSHTAALAVDDDVVDAVCRESGILRVHSAYEGITAVKGFSLPSLRGKSLAVISRSGGWAVVSADACAKHGFYLPELGRDVLDEVRRGSRAGVIPFGNPLDLGDIYDLSFYSRVVEKALLQDDIHGVIFLQSTQMVIEWEENRRLVEKLSELSIQFGKPVAVVMDVKLDERVILEETARFPFFIEPAEAVEALAVNYQWSKRDLRPLPLDIEQDEVVVPVKDIEEWIAAINEEKRQPLLNEAFDLLDRTVIPTVPWHMANSLDEVIEAAKDLGFPVALKAVSPSLLHKSDKGGLALNVQDMVSLRKEWHRLREVSSDISGIVVQKMAPASRELIVGAKRDPLFGPVVLVGLGGIMVEILKDVSMRLAPIDMATALQMFQELSGKRILDRFRGMKEANLLSAARILVQLSQLMHHFPQICEIDLNPVSLDDEGKEAIVLDARLLLST